MPDPVTPDRYCIHQVTLMAQCDYRESIECFARHDVRRTAVWMDKLKAYGADEGRRILDANGIRADALCAALLMEDGRSGAESLDHNRRLLDAANTIGADSLVVITGGLEAGDRDIQGARNRAEARLGALAEAAREAGVKLALEPLHPMICGIRSVISTLGQANDMLDRLAMDDVLSLVVDSYALWWQEDLEAEIKRAGRRIRHLHVSDWLLNTADVRFDRGMPGDGVIDNLAIRGWLEDAGFSGAVEVEIFSADNWWRKDPDEVIQTILDRYPEHL